MPTISNSTYPNITGNKLAFYIESAIKDYPDKEYARDVILDHVKYHIPQKRLSGLVKGHYQLSLHEAMFFSGLFNVSVNELLLTTGIVMPTAAILLAEKIQMKKTG